MPKATDGKTESSSLSSLCMTLTTMAGTDFSFHFFFISFRSYIREKNDGSELIENYLYFYSLDKNDFECLAVRNTVIEGKGAWDEAKYKENSEIMAKLWNEIADLADFDKVRRIDFRLFYKI